MSRNDYICIVHISKYYNSCHTAPVVKRRRHFFIHIPDLAFPCVLSDFLGPGGTSYRPGRKSVLNRKFAENNFFWPET